VSHKWCDPKEHHADCELWATRLRARQVYDSPFPAPKANSTKHPQNNMEYAILMSP